MKKALVTGGAGFIGSHVVDALIARGYRVLVIDDLSSGRREQVHPKAVFIKMDIRSSRFATEVKKWKPEVIVHLAAQIDVRRSVADSELDADINLVASIRLLEAARQVPVKKFIFASSGGAIYGSAKILPTPETYPAKPLSPYGVSKLAFEHYLHCYEHVYGLPYTVLRFSNVYGPRQSARGEAGVIAIFTKKFLSGEQPLVNGDGKNTRDFVYVGDVVRAIALALRPNVHGIFNIGTGVQTSVNILFAMLNRLTRARQSLVHGPAKPGEERRSVLDSRKARRFLGWRPRVTLDQGLARTVAWFKKELGVRSL